MTCRCHCLGALRASWDRAGARSACSSGALLDRHAASCAQWDDVDRRSLSWTGGHRFASRWIVDCRGASKLLGQQR